MSHVTCVALGEYSRLFSTVDRSVRWIILSHEGALICHAKYALMTVLALGDYSRLFSRSYCHTKYALMALMIYSRLGRNDYLLYSVWCSMMTVSAVLKKSK